MPITTPMTIGSLTIDPPLVLAPMAGVTHSPLRQLVASFARPGLFFSEMLSAKSLPADVARNSLWLRRTPEEHPMAYQIFTADVAEAVTGAQHLLAYDAEIIDLNLACPAPNIAAKRKSGAFLLNNLELIAEILTALRRNVACPLTVKIRLGLKPDLTFLRDLVAVLEGCGVDAVTLHPRLTKEKLKRLARWEYIAHLKQMTKMTVIGNGDVKSKADCLRMFAETGCDGVMIGRAAIQKPWLFAEIGGQSFELSPEFLLATYERACSLISDYFPEEKAIGRIKEFTWYFSQNLKFGHSFAVRIQVQPTTQGCREITAQHFLPAV